MHRLPALTVKLFFSCRCHGVQLAVYNIHTLTVNHHQQHNIQCALRPHPDLAQKHNPPTIIVVMSSEQSGSSSINLDTMSLEELNQIKQQEESRLQALTNRYAQLRAAAARLNASQNAIAELAPSSSEGKAVMVPLTESVYVPGTLKDTNKLLVEIGTGFYVEKTAKDTNAFLERKLRLVDANSENITKAVQSTRQNIESITVTMQGKLIEIRARQEGQRHRATVESGAN